MLPTLERSGRVSPTFKTYNVYTLVKIVLRLDEPMTDEWIPALMDVIGTKTLIREIK